MWASLKRHQHPGQYRHGFTIVELLIVVVVIAILAAITIVAYNGIQNRAKASAAQSLVSQANKKILAYAVQNGEQYPDSLTAAGVTNTQGLEYSRNNNVSPRTYGVTATSGNYSFYMSNATSQPLAGGYPGHSSRGVAAVTNQFKNPFFIGSAGGASYTNVNNVMIVDVAGTKYAQSTATSAAAVAMRFNSFADRWSIAADQVVYSRVTVRNPNVDAKTYVITLRFYDTSGAAGGTVLSPSPSSATATTIAPGGTATLSVSGTAPAGTASVLTTLTRSSAGAAIGDLLQGTAIYLGDADVAAASGDTQGWVWNGDANDSSSTGVPL